MSSTPPQTSTTFSIPPHLTKYVIGTKGSNINSIRQQTHTYIQIDNTTGSVTVSLDFKFLHSSAGKATKPEEQQKLVQKARTMILRLVQQFSHKVDSQTALKSPVILIPGRAKSLVIGASGSTIKSLESRFQCKIEFSDNANNRPAAWHMVSSKNSTSSSSPLGEDYLSEMTILCHDNESRWRHCEKAIRKLLKENHWHWNGNTFEERNPLDSTELHSKRQQVQDLALRRNQYFEASQSAYKSGNKKEAADLAKQGHEMNSQLHRIKESMEKHLIRKNVSLEKGLVDLHGLEVEQAKGVLLNALKEYKRSRPKGGAPLEVITGRGVHSNKQGARVKPAVLHMLKAKGYQFEHKNEGSVLVQV